VARSAAHLTGRRGYLSSPAAATAISAAAAAAAVAAAARAGAVAAGEQIEEHVWDSADL
jgi:hypothetical protein